MSDRYYPVTREVPEVKRPEPIGCVCEWSGRKGFSAIACGLHSALHIHRPYSGPCACPCHGVRR